MATLLFLGTGASSGIPVIGCTCSVCTSKDPKNARLRASCLVTIEGKKILIDVGPDFRLQALRYGIDRIDGLAITHTHYDHIGGLEELRIYNYRQKMAIPCLLSRESFSSMKKLFYYLFEKEEGRISFTSQFDYQVLKKAREHTTFCSLPIQTFGYSQGSMHVTGYRFGSLAYVTDIKSYPETIFEDLNGVNTLIISALRFTESHMQLSIDEAVDFSQKVKAKNTYLMHLAHEVDYHHLKQLLPDTIKPAFDGLELEFS